MVRKNAKTESQATQQFIEIDKIREGAVILKDGGLRKVLMVDGINFGLKSEEEQGLITYAYQNFLNSLDFNVQCIVHSRKLAIKEYLEKLQQIETEENNELLKNQINEYRKFINSFVSQNAIMTKKFFVVVPYDPLNLPRLGGKKSGGGKGIFGFLKRKNKTGGENQKPSSEDPVRAEAFKHNMEQLDQRISQVISGLSTIGLRSVPLESSELIELFFNLYNPRATEKKGLEINKEKISGEEARNLIAPAALEVKSSYIKLGDQYVKTLFVFTYPRYLSTGWFVPIINLPELFDISIFVHPLDSAIALKHLRKKTAQIQAEIVENEEKGLVRNPTLETAFQDIESLRNTLQQGSEHLFQVGVYITIYAATLESLGKLENTVTSLLESRLVYIKPAVFQQIEGLNSILPINTDKLSVNNPLNSGPLSSFFPFVATNLTSDDGILYGINQQNNTLIIFDRFSLENANMVIFAKSGAGKSYATKLEAIRLMMTGTDVLIIDPENEYETLANTVGGSFFKISLTSDSHINPFDIPVVPEGEDPNSILKSHILTLTGLIKLMLGEITAEQEALLDQAVSETYASRDIVPGKDFSKAQPPLLSDLRVILENMHGGRELAVRLTKFTEGSYAGFSNQPTNIDVSNRMIVFSIRDLEDELRPIAMYMVLNFIWNMVRSRLKRRVLLIDEAWWMMKYKDGASFLFGLVKRARKYYLGITTITQDIEDFINSPYGRPIVTNSSLQLLLKQSPAMIDSLAKTFNLTDSEKSLLLEVGIGGGLFFAGLKHVAIQIVASFLEDKIVTTNPDQLLSMKE